MNSLMRLVSLAFLLLAAMSLSACSTWSALWSDDDHATHTEASEQAQFTGSIDVLWRNNIDQRQPASPFGFSLPVALQTKQGARVVACGQDKRVRIYDASSGNELYRIALGAACESGGLKLSNGFVVIGDLAGTLFGIDVDQGKVVWRVHLSSSLIGSPVAVADGFIVQTSNNQIYRFNNDGHKQWSYSGLLGGLSMHLTPSPLLYKGHVYAALSNADVLALKADTGNFIWKRQLLLSNKASVMSELKVPVATPLLITAAQSGRDEDVLLVSVFQGALSFLSLQDGSTLSTRKISLKSKPLLTGDQIVMADAAGAVSALYAKNGDTVWKQQISDGELTGPVLWHKSIWVADDKGVVYRLNKQGKVLAKVALNGRIDRAPVVSEYGVLVRNNLGSLYMLH